MEIMTGIGTVLIIAIVIGLLCLKDNPMPLIFTVITMMATTFIFVGTSPPSDRDYLRGELDVKYNKVYQDSILIRTDTNNKNTHEYRFKRLSEASI